MGILTLFDIYKILYIISIRMRYPTPDSIKEFLIH